jgi:hypothetical protein
MRRLLSRIIVPFQLKTLVISTRNVRGKREHSSLLNKRASLSRYKVKVEDLVSVEDQEG